ncbi:HAMP domain-containing histidine kinase [Candidatus Gracilibacteria bacterium]|nr:HAMP domain-containing histidine kinase [Candidatus Gracilibacteria bacterium]
MKFSQKFLITNFLILVFVILANIIALKYYSDSYFSDYVSSVRQKTPNVDFDLIANLLNKNTIDSQTFEEYQKITKDLRDISNSLEKFSKNPKTSNISLIESLQKIGLPSSSIEQVIGTNALQSFFSNAFNFFSLDLKTPEGVFVLRTIKSMAIFNLILIVLILIFSYIWISITFKPIKKIILNLSDIIYKKEYKNILYKKKDEFKPLIEAINNLNKSLSLQEKIRSDFLSDLSHEIKTPITAVKCYLEGIEDGVIKLNKNNIKQLHEEINRLIEITNLIMEFEKEENQNFGDLIISKISLEGLINFVKTAYTSELQKNNQKINYDSKIKINIRVDKNKFTQVIHNIFSNFLRYAGKNTTLQIDAFNKGNYSYINFFDNGKGVSKEEIPFLKEKFYKIDKSRAKKSSIGVGIGLSIIDRIIKLHGGEFEIDTDIKKGFQIKIKLIN